MSALQSLLEKINAGTTSFQPASQDEADMRAFQPIAEMINSAFNEGFLESCQPHNESWSGHSWYDLVLVNGGLSLKGKKFLEKPKA